MGSSRSANPPSHGRAGAPPHSPGSAANSAPPEAALRPAVLLRPLLLAAALLWLPWALATGIDVDAQGWRIPAAVAFLPYAAAGTGLVLVVALIARARLAATCATLGLLILLAPRIDRFTTDEQPPATGPGLTIATANVYVGHGDPHVLIRLVRDDRVDLLAIQENTPEWDAAATRAGLRRLLPHRASAPDPRPGAAGLALWSRWPIERRTTPGDGGRSLGGTITIPGSRTPIHVRSVHPYPPFETANLPCWQRCTRALAGAATPGVDAILAGDFNATLDHHPMRTLLHRDFRDTAEQTGQAWRPTWSNGRWATLTLDHILVTHRIAITQVTTHDLPGSDHDVVLTRLRLPR